MGVSGKEKDRHDYYFKKARAEHYRARSVYKLKEIQEHFKLARRGMTLVDLGAAPGSWSQYAAELVGPAGRVVAIDRTALEPGLPPQVTPLQLDMLEVTPELLRERAGVTRVHGVLSDMAPNTSGIRGVDHQRSVELCERALAVAELLLEPGGWFVCKVFQGEEVQPFLRQLKARFGEARIFKPRASKDESVETFLVAQRYSGAGEGRPQTGEGATSTTDGRRGAGETGPGIEDGSRRTGKEGQRAGEAAPARQEAPAKKVWDPLDDG